MTRAPKALISALYSLFSPHSIKPIFRLHNKPESRQGVMGMSEIPTPKNAHKTSPSPPHCKTSEILSVSPEIVGHNRRIEKLKRYALLVVLVNRYLSPHL